MELRPPAIEHSPLLRLPTPGTVVVRGPRGEIRGRLTMFATGEIEVSWPRRTAVPAAAGEPVDVSVCLDSVYNGWLELYGRVRRVDGLAHRLVIAIDELPPEFAGVIAANLARAHVSRREVTVIS
jgi:hypothetical protein